MPTSNRIYEIEKKAFDFIISHKLIVDSDNVLVALSGGPDSVFALHLLLKLSDQLNFTVEAAHVNHMLRGKESDGDEQFCSQLCKKLSIPFHSRQVDIPVLKKNSNRSVEEIARSERYKFFAELTEQYSFDKLVTAHNKNDNAETTLLNLFKGSGISGLSGIPIIRDNIIRPFLSHSKKEILEYLKKNGFDFRLDSSNKLIDFERNYIRNEIIPLLEKSINPKVVDSIGQTSNNLKLVYNFLQHKTGDLWEKFITNDELVYDINLQLFQLEEAALIGEILKKLFTEKIGIEFNSNIYRILTDLSKNQVGKSINLASGFEATREREVIRILKSKEESEILVEFLPGQSVKTSRFEIITELVDLPEYKTIIDEGCEFISADNLTDIFILRNWKSGDRFFPLGMNGHKKLSDYLTDRKIPNTSKKEICVLISGDEIVWVVGFGINDRYKINNNTKRVCKLCLKRL